MCVNWLSYHQISRLSNMANQLEDQTTSCTLLFIWGVLVGVPGRQAGWWCVLRGKCFKVRTHASCTEKLLIWFSEFYLQEQETVLIYKLIIYKLKSSIYDLWICDFFTYSRRGTCAAAQSIWSQTVAAVASPGMEPSEQSFVTNVTIRIPSHIQSSETHAIPLAGWQDGIVPPEVQPVW